jgi:transcriptional regulator with XRE-family HTH domain
MPTPTPKSRDDRLGLVIGRACRDVREAIGWSQRELERRTGHSQSKIARFESGDVRHLDLELADDVLRELGIRLRIDRPELGLSDRNRQRDGVHAWCCGYAGRRLAADGWTVRHEVEVGTGRTRGWIDLLAYREVDGALFCPELKTEIHDAGAIQRTLAWYEREAWDAARRVGWRPRRMTSALLVLATSENDGRPLGNQELLRQAFPGDAPALWRWLSERTAAMPPRSIAMIDPHSRRSVWLRPTRSDGRRSPAPYRNYADAAQRLRGS